jgi:hypothetical protein
VTKSQEIAPDQHLEESTILDLGEQAFGLFETSTTDLLAPTIIPIHPYECQTVSHAAMETNVVIPYRNSSIPTMVVTTGEFLPPNLLSLVQATMVSTASKLHSGLIPSLAVATTPFTPSVKGPPFSYGMPSPGTSPVLSYSTSQTSGLGVGSSNAPLQGHMRGTPNPFNAFPYGGGHIPPSSPSFGGVHQQSTEPPTHHSLFGAGSQGPPLHNMLVGLTSFSLFGAFGNNAFSSATFPTRGNPGFGQPIPLHGTIPAQGAHPGTSSIAGPWNSWQGSVPSSGMSIWGNSFHNQWNHGQSTMPIPMGLTWSNPSQSPLNVMHAQPYMSYFRN